MGAPGWYYLFSTVFGGVGALVGLVGGIFGVISFFRSKAADKRSKATEAELAEERKQRHAEVLEVQRQMAQAISALTEPPPPTVEWMLERLGDEYYVLRNVGDASAVGLEVEEIPLLNFPDPVPDTVAPGQGVELMLLSVAEEASPTELRVRWDGQDDWVMVPVR